MSPYRSPLLISPIFTNPTYLQITPASAGWEHLNFVACQLDRGETWSFDTSEYELALVVLGGVCSVKSNRGNWSQVGHRQGVFEGMPYTLYLPTHTQFTVTSNSNKLDFACGWCRTTEEYPARLVTPTDVEVEIRGGGNVTRQINKMIPPGFACSRLVVVEVYTPSGNWSSYPPHKHDRHTLDENGDLIEADLEEVYFYKIDQPQGFAYQRIYTADQQMDELILVHDSDLVLSPQGYHPVVAAPGYHCYYLNMLAGSAQSLAASDDSDHVWVKDTFLEKDPRLPLVSLDMEST